MHEQYMEEAIRLAEEAMRKGRGGPFGAVIVKNDEIVGRGQNRVLLRNDPTAHAEVEAIRDASKHLHNYELQDCTIYTSCEPCPMCLGAIYWARLERVFYAADRKDAGAIGFDDQFIYQELKKPINKRKIELLPMHREYALELFEEWRNKKDKQQY